MWKFWTALHRLFFPEGGVAGGPLALGKFGGKAAIFCLAFTGAAKPASLHAAEPEPGKRIRVAYPSDGPVSWRPATADPLRNLGLALQGAFASTPGNETAGPGLHLQGAQSWEELSQTLQLGGAEVFPMQSQELLAHQKTFNLKPLLVATRNGTWKTHFLLLSSRSSGIRNLQDLEGRTVLVHRDGCGNLVDLWLDAAIAVGTGLPRKSFARYQTVTHAREAILPVFFGEAEACVVSNHALEMVRLQNPQQISEKLDLVLARSDSFPTQVVACRQDLPQSTQKQILERALSLTWEHRNGTGGLMLPEPECFTPLRDLIHGRLTLPPPVQPAPPPGTDPPASARNPAAGTRSPVQAAKKPGATSTGALTSSGSSTLPRPGSQPVPPTAVAPRP